MLLMATLLNKQCLLDITDAYAAIPKILTVLLQQQLFANMKINYSTVY